MSLMYWMIASLQTECFPCCVCIRTVHTTGLAQQRIMNAHQGQQMQDSTQESIVQKPALATAAGVVTATASACPAATCKLRYRLVPYCSAAVIAWPLQECKWRCWLSHLGLRITQVSMAHWAQRCVRGFRSVMTRPVQTFLLARQCFQPHGNPDGCIRWTSHRFSAGSKRSPQPVIAQVESGNAHAAPAQVCMGDVFDRGVAAEIVSETRCSTLHVDTYSGRCSVLTPWLYLAHNISYRFMPSPLAGAGTFVQISAYCTTAQRSGSACMCIWNMPATALYRTPVYQYCSISSLHCYMPKPRSPLPRRRPPREELESEVDPQCREPLRRVRVQRAESSSQALQVRTPLPRLRSRTTGWDVDRCKGELPAVSARQPAARKARPQPKLHPWTSMAPLDRVVIRPRRTDDRAGPQDAKVMATGDDEDSSSTEDIRVCSTPVAPTASATSAQLVGRAKIRFKPRPVPPSKAAKTRKDRPGSSRDGLTATGASAKQKARQRKIRGSLRECLRVGARATPKSKAMPSKGKHKTPRTGTNTRERSGQAPATLIPPASQQAPTHARLDMEAVAVLEPTDWTVVTDRPLPSGAIETCETSAPTTVVTTCSRSQETKEALLRWQREQFVQRAELARMQATMQPESHPNPEPYDASVYMGLPASPHVLWCLRLHMMHALSLFTYAEDAFWYAHETAHVCWTITLHTPLMLTFRSSGWSWLLSTRSSPYSVCAQLTMMHSICGLVPYRVRLCTYMLCRRLLIVIRLCVGILLVWWRALFGTCLCGLRCKRWNIQARRFGRTPHPRDDTKLQLPIRRSATPPPDVQKSRLGPKSESNRRATGNHSCRAVRVFFLLLCFAQFLLRPVGGARVAADSTPAAGVHEHSTPQGQTPKAAKPSGNHDIRTQPVYAQARKRAFKRAMTRAQTQGVTRYRGRTMTLQQLAGMQGQPAQRETSHGARRKDALTHTGDAACLLSWNVGGLSNAILDELFIWLALPQHQRIKIVLLQETRWQFTSEWESESWFILHSGHSKQKGAGVMTLISKDICNVDDVRSCEIASGRVLHVRIPAPGGLTSFDIVNVYQHAWDNRADAAELRRKRARILEKVDTCIQQVPWRNQCICAGDWNVQLAPSPGMIGHSTVHLDTQRQSAPDVEALLDVMIARHMIALNTWTGPRRQAFTFSHQGCRTQIDYIFARRHQTTGDMRRCRPLQAFPVTAWRQSGLHRPLVTLLDYKWQPNSRNFSSRRVDTDAIANAVQWQTPQLHSFQHAVQTSLCNRAHTGTLDLHQVLYDCCVRHFPAVANRREYAHQHPEVQQVVRSRWQHLHRGKLYRHSAASDLRSAWRCWHHFARFRALRREANRASRQARKQRIEHLLHEAERFASQNNVHKLYAIIRQIAPKQPFRRVKIYGEEGEILSRAEEVERLRTHFSSIFQGRSESWQHTCHDVVTPPSVYDVSWALARTPLRKAVPKHFAPGAAWRAAAHIVAPIVHDAVRRVWSTACVPQHWKDGWLVLMCKPNRPGRGPGDFRPLCLQDPCGKAVIKLVADNIRPAVQAFAARCPQHAYLPGRSTEGALLGVFARCRQIRELTKQSGNSIYARRSGMTVAPYTGGYILSLDLSMAFDAVPRALVRDSLLAAGVQNKDVQIIMEWLTGSTYHLLHGHINLKVLTERGVRQGCVLSPLIWTCFTCHIAYQLEPLIPLDDMQVYADDFLLSRIFHTRAEFLESLRMIPLFISGLASFGLKVNVGKTALLIRMARGEGRALLRQHVCTNSKGTFLSWLQDKPLYVPIKTSHVYLGCVISFFDFESQTVRRRMDNARNQFSRLRNVLTSSRCLSLKRRARIWRTCVWSTLIYGWACCGCSGFQLSQVLGLVNTQLRAIARSPRHITQTSNAEVYSMLGLPDPIELVTQAAANLHRRLDYSWHTTDVVMQNPELHKQATWARERLTDATAGCRRLERITPTEGVACPECGIYFDCETSMRKHRSRKHPEANKPALIDISSLRRESFCIDGMPICRGCGKHFHHTQTLLRHIKNNRCPGFRIEGDTIQQVHYLSSQSSSQQPPPQQQQPVKEEPTPIIRQLPFLDNCIREGTAALLSALKSQKGLRHELLHHCGICRQWMSDPRRFKTHMRHSHKDLFEACFDKAVADCRALTGAIMSPCEFCGQEFTNKARHAAGCTVLFQVAFACRAHDRTHSGGHALTLRGSVASHQSASAGSPGFPRTVRVGPSNTDAEQGREEEQSRTPREAAEVPEAQQQQRPGKGQREKQGQEATRGIRAFFSSAQPRGQSGTIGCPTLPATRGCHQYTQDGPGLRHALQNSGRRDHVENNSRFGGSVERTADREADGLRKKNCVDQGCGDGITDPGQGSPGETREAESVGSDGLARAARRARTGMDSLGMECCSAERNTMSRCRAPPSVGRSEGVGGPARARVGPDSAEIPPHASVGRGVHRRDHGIQTRNQFEGQGSTSGTRGIGHAVQFGAMATGGCEDAHRGAETFGRGEEAATPASRVLALKLHNSGNYCYQNAFVMSWLWAIVQAHQRQVGGCIDDRIGRCSAIIHALLIGKCDRLTKVFAWSAILQQWSRPQQQHDIGEFATHALPKLRTHLMQGSWFARKELPYCRDVDTGPLHMPILMPIPNGADNIQACVEAWCHQDNAHALGIAPPLLLVQLGRFRHRSHRHVRKYRGEVILDGIIPMPIFIDENSLELTYAQYRVISGAYHLGNTPASGHYQAVLYEASTLQHQEGGHPCEPVTYSTDDGRCPRRCNNAELDDALHNMYLVWLMKC